MTHALTLDEPERTRLLRLATSALHVARQELRAVRDADRRRPRLGAVAPAAAGATGGTVLTRVRNHKAATAAVVGTAAAAALAIGITQLPDGAPDGGQARPPATSPAPSATLPPGPIPEGGPPSEKRPTMSHPGEVRTDPRTLTTTGTRPGEAPTEPGQPGPAITDDVTPPASTLDPPDPSEPAPTDPPTTPPPATSSPPNPSDPPRSGPGGLLCLEVGLGWLVDLELCVL